MHALRNQCRPKHQVLVLKCYPRHQKNSVELKPNSSELSYLLYYASTRRSKLQKVADFLDKRAISDVWNVRIGKVSVTLQILRALIEKCPRDLPLYAAATLRIFKTILNSLDVTMIEETIPTWTVFCSHQDPAILAADQDYIRQYEEIVRLYASFASKDTPVQHKSAKSLPVRIRFRRAGLSAIQSLAESESLSSETARQLSIIVPSILENIYADSGQYLDTLEHKQVERHELEKELALKRRQSTSVLPTGGPTLSDPAAASGSIEAADRLAEQETGVIALQALKKIFAVLPRGQLRLAALQVLKFMGDRISPQQHFPAATVIPLQSGSWPCTLLGMICGWTPVQDRHVILVTAVEELVHTPLREETFERQYVLVTITGWLLSSDVNFIGLSVMDVLVGLLGHMSALLQVSIPPPASEKGDLENSNNGDVEKSLSPDQEHQEFEGAYPISASKSQLVSQIQRCVGCLAVHVYYSEQISDMISAILARIRPTAAAAVLSASSTHDNAPERSGSAISLSERRSVGGLFTFDKARLAGLKAIKEVLIWANWKRPDGSSKTASRNPVQISRWDGTPWLLRESSWEVRLAYVDVLLTWMNYELRKPDLKVPEPKARRSRKSDKREATQRDSNLARRAVSNASQRELSPPRPKSNFMALLHLAIYDNAQQFATSEGDIVLLHLLTSSLIAKLGVNSLQDGLPMMKRLQEDIADFDDPVSKIQVASLVYGYLWAASVHFHFDASATGRAIALEISQRMKRGTWLHSIRMPPMPLEEVAQKGTSSYLDITPEEAESIQLTPFDKFDTMIEKIAEGYEVSLYSPPSSPPTSPSRKLTTPILEQPMTVLSSQRPTSQLPQSVRENFASTWTREAVISFTSKHNESHSGSMSGSPTANGSGKHLSVHATPHGASNGDLPSPRRSHAHFGSLQVPQSRSGRPSSAQHNHRDSHRPHSLRDAFQLNLSGPRSSRASRIGTPVTTTSSVRSAVKVEDLKRVLSGEIPMPQSSMLTRSEEPEPVDSASDSMISYDDSEASTSAHTTDTSGDQRVSQAMGNLSVRHNRSASLGSSKDANTDGSITPRPTTAVSAVPARSSTARRSSTSPEPGGQMMDIPPVPPLPESYASLSPPRTSISSSYGGTVLSTTSPRTSARPSSKSGTPMPTSKADSIKSQNVRESLRRSISTRDGTLPTTKHGGHDVPKGTWSAIDLLDSIESESVGPVPGTGILKTGIGLKPPY